MAFPAGMFTPRHVPLFGGGVLAVHRDRLYATTLHTQTRDAQLLHLTPIGAIPSETPPAVMPSYTLCKPTRLNFYDGKLVYYRGASDTGFSLVSFNPGDHPATRVRNEHLRPLRFPAGDLALLDGRDIVRVTRVLNSFNREVRNYERCIYETVALTRLQRIERVNVAWTSNGMPLTSERSIYFNSVGDNIDCLVFRTPGTRQDFSVDVLHPDTRFSFAVPERVATTYATTPPPLPGAPVPMPAPPTQTTFLPSNNPVRGYDTRYDGRSRRPIGFNQSRFPNHQAVRPPLRHVVPDDAD